jgi:subtilisin family serine protease
MSHPGSGLYRDSVRSAPVVLEPIEPRVLLSGASEGVVDIPWGGVSAPAWSDEYVLRLESESTSTDAVESSLNTWGYSDVVCERLGPGEFASLHVEGASLSRLKTWASQESLVRYLEPDFLQENGPTSDSLIPTDERMEYLWGLHNVGQGSGTEDADIDAPEAWALTTGSSDVVVAVIDTGIDYTHPDLAANVWTNPGEIAGDGLDNDHNGYIDDIHGWDFRNNDSDPMDGHGHGTHVSGTIGATGNTDGVVGVSWDVEIMGLKFLSDSGSGSTIHAIRAINYATMMKQVYGVNVVATNNSWGGGGYSQALHDAIAAGGRAGILFVAAAGNTHGNNDTIPHYPANYDLDCVISVAASTYYDTQATFSNYGRTSVDLAAPGSVIMSTYPGARYAVCNGTSMAAPHVTGTIALMAAYDRSASSTEIKSAIMESVDPMPSMAGRSVTAGRLNAYGALTQLAEPEPLPDLAIDSVDYPVDGVAPGGTISLDVTVVNQGEGAVDGDDVFALEVRVSRDRTWGDADDYVVHCGFPSDGLAAGGQWVQTIEWNAPSDAELGDYYVAVRLDGAGVVTESNEDNNLWWSEGAGLTIAEESPEDHFVRDGASLLVTGTAGNDTLHVRLGVAGVVGHVVRLNHWTYVYNAAEVHAIHLVGAGGRDAVEVLGTDLDETALLRADGVGSFTSGIDLVTFEGAAQANVYGREGTDTVRFFDSAGDDQLVSTESYAYLKTDGAFLYAGRFENVYAFATEGGTDVAGLYDTPGDDHFLGAPSYGLLRSQETTLLAHGFDQVHARAVLGGRDTAELAGSSGNDLFLAQPNSSLMMGADFRNVASGFDDVIGRGEAGDDLAYVYDSAGDDVLVARDGTAELSGAGFSLTSEAFRRVFVFSRRGSDVARLYDSPGNDRFVATPDYGCFSVDGASYCAAGFGEVYAYATAGGRDSARLHDSAGNDCFVACETYGQLSGPGYLNHARGFDEVRASARNGGTDTAYLYDSAGDDCFVATPTFSSLWNAEFANHAMAFDRVYASADGGNDVARLYDSEGDDRFVGTPDESYMLGDGFMNSVSGFGRVFAHAESGGHDVAQMYDSAGDDTFVGSANQGQVSGEGFLFRAQKFEQVYAYSTNGGNDSAILYDSTGDDRYFGRGDYGYIQGDGYFHRVDSFHTTQLYGTRGGVNALDVLDLARPLLTRGVWEA